MIRLSIIIPSFNTKEMTIRCLKSLTSLKTGTEIIVVDNESKDETVEEIKKIKDIKNIKIIKNKENLGFAKAINQGLETARGKYILILNSDTIIQNNTIDNEIKFLETYPEVGAVGCQLKNPDGSIQPSGGYLPNLWRVFLWMSFIEDLPIIKKIVKPYHVTDREFFTHQHYLGWVSGAFILTKKEVIEKVGLFDEQIFMYVEEVEWFMRLNKAGYKIVFDPSNSIIHYKGASSLGGNKAGIVGGFQGIIYLFKKHKPSWQIYIVRCLLKIGALARILLFGIIKHDLETQRLYEKAFKLV